MFSNRRAWRGWAAGATWVALAACGSRYAPERVASGDASLEPAADPRRCSSGSVWHPDLQAGADMAPGRACVACHAEENGATGELDAPLFAVAGTVYPTAHEPDDCRAPAAQGAVIRVRDRQGQEVEAVANEVGNFFVDETSGFAPPFMVVVSFQGRERKMLTPAPSGDCGSCHTQDGAGAAPGRVVLP